MIFLISMVVGTIFVFADPYSDIFYYIYLGPSILLFVFAMVFIIVTIPLSIAIRRATAKSEDQIRHFFEKLNHERFMARGVQLRVETTLNLVIVATGRNNIRQRLQLRLVIEVVPRH